ncbi:MAG TPA: transcriptional regulator NrdR [Patescibacteria group bacterium]|nr:transcriptional regulator NrdR [Patescibacteria group bacterium]
MRCPFCNHEDTQVKDSRPAEESVAIRRRRECTECNARFTTFERIQLRDMTVIKSGERRQPFDRDKISRSMQIALRKRPVSVEEIEKTVSHIVRQLESHGEPEIKAAQIGELVMRALAKLDTVGYIRYASVYKDFCQPEDFKDFLEEMKHLRKGPDREAAE